MDELHEVARLPETTAECEEGPVIEFRFGKATVWYDTEGEQGAKWTSVTFLGAVATRTTPDPAVSEQMVKAYSKVCVFNDSSWLSKLRSRGEAAGLAYGTILRHYLIYFDHHGCIEIAATDFTIGE
ncbi:MAG: hypothetical protein AAFQ65_02010 [Myxococcota bacterium]